MTVAFTSLSVNDAGSLTTFTPNNYVAPVVLDSGTASAFLNPAVVNPLIENVGAIPDPNYGYVVSCNIYSNYSGSLVFGFGGPQGASIVVPFKELLIPIGKPYTFADGSQACGRGLWPTADLGSGEISANILGDTFMRSANIIYDLDNKEISLA
ncbi:hypothetical protein MMC13_000502 [Lambiella insularis]|nr:hypothetical protein [Lambiella insularis]